MKKGFSLIEILVTLAIFSLVSVLLTQSLFQSLSNTRKSDALTRVRENLNYAVSVMDRHLRGAKSLTSCSSSPSPRIDYTSQGDQALYFSCEGLPTGYVASSSASIRLTSTEVDLTACTFTCTFPANLPPYIVMGLTGKDKNTQGAESELVTVSTRVNLRSY